jgi:integrase
MQSLSGVATATGHYRKCGIYRSLLGRICLYCNDEIPSFNEVFDPGFLFNFQDYLLMDGLKRSTVSFYLRTLRSLHKPAVDAGETPPAPGLFAGVFTGQVETKKRALPAEAVARLYAADLSEYPHLERCRNMFMASLFLQGMAFADLIRLRKIDLEDDQLMYIRKKTDKPIGVYMLNEAKGFLARLTDENVKTPYLLPIVTEAGEKGYTQHQSGLHLYNRHLKLLAAHLGIEQNITSHTARHTWATMAHNNNVSMADISEGLGHKTEEMTRIYIAALGFERKKDINQIVLNAVLQPIKDGLVTNMREEVRLSMEAFIPKQPQMPQMHTAMALSQESKMIEYFIGQETPAQRKFNPKEEPKPNRAERRRREKEEKKWNKQKKRK